MADRTSTPGSSGLTLLGSTSGLFPVSSPSQSEDGVVSFNHLRPFQVTMIAIGGAINTGLMIGAGNALAKYWLKFIVITPNRLTAAALVASYWVDAETLNPGIWIAIFLTVIIVANYWGSRFFGQYEFILSTFKIVVVLGLLILSLVLALGGGPDHDRKGFRYWKNHGAFAGERTHIGRLRAICKTMPSATFTYSGSELIGVSILHSHNPRRAAARAIQLTFYRILVLNLVGIILLGMLVPYNLDDLAITSTDKVTTASVFVVAVQGAHAAVLLHFLNACLLLFVLSSANQALWVATRIFHGLAIDHHAPALLSQTGFTGTPIVALGVCSVLSSLSCLNISGDSRTFFDQFVNMSTMFSLLAWISILVTHLAFLRARKAQSVPDKALAFKAPLGAVGSAVALAFCVLIIVIRSFDIVDPGASIRRFDYIAFLTSYLAIPLYVCLIVGYKGFTRCASVSPSDVDLGVVKDETDGSEDVIVQCAQDVSCTRIHQGEKPSRRSWPRARFQG
ncbi:putative amino acid permease [Aspergillus candidus]|uniref:Amino acid permease-domain-containing protein n=1 Tax=Aspergillus candidus TaxID=41067 RepID=A0A2I2F542_ASPCN|nr:amino acid permease-domain-containing protein [Aspergillus candidus]PLB35769.1 amino acid permease-domain-containing protein [Aspergillus candidus]